MDDGGGRERERRSERRKSEFWHVFGAAWGDVEGRTPTSSFCPAFPVVGRHAIDSLSLSQSPSTMLHALTNYIAERRRGLTKVVAYAGSAYLIGRYVSHSLQDVREGVVQDRIAREKYVHSSSFVCSFVCLMGGCKT